MTVICDGGPYHGKTVETTRKVFDVMSKSSGEAVVITGPSEVLTGNMPTDHPSRLLALGFDATRYIVSDVVDTTSRLAVAVPAHEYPTERGSNAPRP